ncbi:MAG TPA: SCO family protein [Candidatus Sulfopaludibacter sp.]|nr:SCO family protein [Candidatus Sulfopaludibacter sp.]
MPKKAGPKRRKQRNNERFFAVVLVIWSLLFGAGYWLLLFAMNNRDNNPVSGADYVEENPESNLIPPDHPRQLIDFQLTDRTEHTVTRSDLNGKILIVDFLFTSCSLTCPAVNRQMARIQQLTTNRPGVKLVSLTVDPRDDTPAVLEKYGERFGADTNRWLFLTGDKAQLYDLIGTSFLASDTNDAFGYMPGNFAHTERIAVVDANGRLRGYFDGLNQNTAAAVVNEITKLQNL